MNPELSKSYNLKIIRICKLEEMQFFYLSYATFSLDALSAHFTEIS